MECNDDLMGLIAKTSCISAVKDRVLFLWSTKVDTMANLLTPAHSPAVCACVCRRIFLLTLLTMEYTPSNLDP